MKRCFIYQDEKSQKFWNIDIGDTTFIVNYGRLGTQGQTQEKSFAQAEDCQKAAQKAIDEKIKKGYTEVSEETVANTADEAKRFSLTYDEQEDEGIELLFKNSGLQKISHTKTYDHRQLARSLCQQRRRRYSMAYRTQRKISAVGKPAYRRYDLRRM